MNLHPAPVPGGRLRGASQHRCHSLYLSFGGNIEKLILELIGNKNGCTYGMGGSLSIHSENINMFGHDGFLGSNVCIGVGACFSSNKPTIIFMGDSTIEEDHTLSSLGWASTRNLPILFVVEDNNYAILTEKKEIRALRLLMSISWSFFPWLSGPRSFLPTVFLIFGIRFQNGAKERFV